MQKSKLVTLFCTGLMAVFIWSCSPGHDTRETAEEGQRQEEQAMQSDEKEGEHAEGRESEGEHAEHEETDEFGRESETEESDARIALNEILEQVRQGTRLTLSFDKKTSTFAGTVENISSEALKNVRIEVHLSNGTELGPTDEIDLKPGQKTEVELSAEGQIFEWWTAHAEVGESEHHEEERIQGR